ncbi:MAG: 3-deoxy-D-manno-octulosonic acid transferase [Bacteroidales bacterium]|nr:3-deoxy-D-manno-octulosonic acid transferase [Bacteroidales bacterium]
MRFFYNLSIKLYTSAIYIASLKNKKAKLWIKGRKNLFKDLENKCKNKQHIIWFHCASLGEFEQGRPLIEMIKKEKPETTILLTFFSPSGYEYRKNYALADIITYLPADTSRNAKKFLSIVQPKHIFFIKYEYWFNYINEAFKQKIPFYMISAIFRKNQRFFAPYGFWFRKELSKITHFFLQNEESKKLLNSIHITQCDVVGDTRFDTVSELSPYKDSIIDSFCEHQEVFIAGSTWKEDELMLKSHIKNRDVKWIIAPHEIYQERISQIKTFFDSLGCISYTEAHKITNFNPYKILIIDKIGMLKNIYHYGKIAYIGGGFGKGIHNVLEAATFGKPIIFGPNYKHFKEANDLVEKRVAFSVRNDNELITTIKNLSQPTLLQKTSDAARTYIDTHKGASKKIFSFVFMK